MNIVVDEAQSAFLPGRLIMDNATTSFEAFHSIALTQPFQLFSSHGFKAGHEQNFWLSGVAILGNNNVENEFSTPFSSAHHELHYVCLLFGLTEWHPNMVFPFSRHSSRRSAFSLSFYFMPRRVLDSFTSSKRKWCGSGVGLCRRGYYLTSPLCRTLYFLLILLSLKQHIWRRFFPYMKTTLDKPLILTNPVCSSYNLTQNIKYLGLPFMIDRSKKEIFCYLHDRVWTKLNSWNEKTLLQATKEVLIKSVISGHPCLYYVRFSSPSLHDKFHYWSYT